MMKNGIEIRLLCAFNFCSYPPTACYSLGDRPSERGSIFTYKESGKKGESEMETVKKLKSSFLGVAK